MIEPVSSWPHSFQFRRAECTLTTGVPRSAARCLGPESLPTNTSANETSASKASNDRRPSIRLKRAESRSAAGSDAASSVPSVSSNTLSSVASSSRSASWLKPGHRLNSSRAPAWSRAYRSPPPSPRSTSISRCRSVRRSIRARLFRLAPRRSTRARILVDCAAISEPLRGSWVWPSKPPVSHGQSWSWKP